MIAFDFDGTLIDDHGRPNMVPLTLLRRCLKHRLPVRVITSRNPEHECVVWRNAHEPRRVLVRELLASEELRLQVTFTRHRPKALAMRQLGVGLLFDNDAAELAAARGAMLEGVLIDEGLAAPQKPSICLECGWSSYFVGRRGESCTVCGASSQNQRPKAVNVYRQWRAAGVRPAQ